VYRYPLPDHRLTSDPHPALRLLARDEHEHELALACGQMPTPDQPPADRPAAADLAASPQLSIERLMAQLVERASEIITSQERVRALLAANQSIVGNLALPVVLRRIVEAAATVAGARYAALGVIGPDGLLEQFVHTGMDSDTVHAIGDLPKGRGVLGAVIAHPDPIRLRVIGDDPRSSGFPDGHPPMTTFVGVPIRSRGMVFGNLYLTDRMDGRDFTDEDVELLEALASTAGIAIENARLYEESERRQLWLRASSSISRELLSGTGQELEVLEHIAATVQRLAAADVVTLVLAQDDGSDELAVTVATGLGADELVGTSFPASNSLAECVMHQGHGLLLGADAPRPQSVHLDMVVPAGPVMALPLTGNEVSRGAVVVGRLASRAPFNQADLEMAEAFAEQAALALELAQARADQQRLTVLEDRDRIGRDLHDHVIQRLFASELGAQSLAEKSTQPEVRAGLARTISELTATIRQIRSTIFALREPAAATHSLRRTVSLLVAQLTPLLGFRPEIHLAGPLDTLADDEMLSDVEAVLRESLTNISRHAAATAAEVTVAVNSQRLVVTVSDNGVGLATGDWSGLANLRSRAERRGGSLVLDCSPEGGLRLQWTIPITL
jgi:signal transduction histidine kinase